MTLIPYAGKDDRYEIPFSTRIKATSRERPETRPSRALNLFRLGYDTVDLAERFRVREHTILRWINTERSKRLNRDNPYEARR